MRRHGQDSYAATVLPWVNILAFAAAAAALTLAARWVALETGVGASVFGFGLGNNATSFPAVPVRPALYPLFVSALLPLGIWAVMAVQTWAYFITGFALVTALYRVLVPSAFSRIVIGLIGFASLCNPRTLEYQLALSEEGLFIPVLVGLMACILRHLTWPRLTTALIAGLLTGLAVGIRSIGITFVPVVIIALLLPWLLRMDAPCPARRALTCLIAVVAGAVAGVLLERVAYRALLGDTPRGTVMGINLIAKMPFIVEPGDLEADQAPDAEQPHLRAVEQHLLRDRDLHRRAMQALSRADARQFVTNFLEFEFQLRGGSPGLLKAVTAVGKVRGQSPSAAAEALSLRIIRKHPWRFAGQVWGNLLRFFWLAEFPEPGGLAEARALPAKIGQSTWRAQIQSGYQATIEAAAAYRWPAWLVRLAHVAALLSFIIAAGAYLAGLIVRRRVSTATVMIFLTGLALVGYILGCAIAINVQVRYLMTIWPLTVIAGAGLLLMLLARRAPAGTASDGSVLPIGRAG